MNNPKLNSQSGFSLLELVIGMTVTLILLSVLSMVIHRATGVNAREGRKADALVSAQAALNVMSREIGNAGFGIYLDGTTQTPSNGIVAADSNARQIHIRSNFSNVGDYTAPAGSTVLNTNDPGEDVTYFFDAATSSIVRYDPNLPVAERTSVIVNRISDVTFEYFNYTTSSSTVTQTTSPTTATGRVRINVQVQLDPVVGQAQNETVSFTSDVTLRNSNYMLRQY
jgi:prepilin-type N-terminal cleavage/methylation domain-containing protein